MPAFSGYHFTLSGTEIDQFYRDSHISVSASAMSGQMFLVEASGPLTKSGLFQPAGPSTHAGYACDGYREMFHSQVYVVPAELQLGTVVTDVTKYVDVWNAYLKDSPDNTLASITEVNVSGLVLSGITQPKTFKPGESVLTTLDIPQVGVPEIDCTYIFNFTSEAPTLKVSGLRTVVWPFEPNWSNPVEEVLEWLSSVVNSDDGSEQVSSLRGVPRRTYRYRSTVIQEKQRTMQSILWGWQSLIFVLPVWADKTSLASPLPSGSVTVPVVPQYLDYHTGGLAVIMLGFNLYEVVEIDSVGPTELNLVKGTLLDWPERAEIYPARLARMKDTQQVSALAATIAEMQVEFAVEDNSTDIVPAEFGVATYLGYPVLEEEPNMRNDRSLEYNRTLQTFDNETKGTLVEDMTNRPVTVHDYLWTSFNKASIYKVRQWLFARGGKTSRIWVPTFQVDLLLASPVSPTDISIRVGYIGYYKFLKQQLGRRDIRILLRNGQSVYRRVTGAIATSDSVEQLTLDSALGINVEIADVHMISFIQLSRLGSDSVNLSWVTPTVQDCKHTVRSVSDDV